MCLEHRPHADTSPADSPGEGDVRPLFTRRHFMVALVGVGGTVVTGCVGTGDTGLGLNLVSPVQVEQLGVESWQRIRAENRASTNRSYQQALQRVGTDILQAIGENPRNWEMVVFAGNEANAFALPGGKIGVYEGMFRYIENDAQLATIVAHEIGHNQAAHAAERLNSAAATQIGLQLVSVALQAGNIGYANQVAAMLGAGVQYGVILPYSRNQELEADRIGVLNMARAGYDPRASIALWQNMQSAGPRPPGFLSTHPAPEARIVALESLMPEAMPIYQRSS